ncbi:enoyl-CoA hydratase/isomerase family protein [Ramlibacter tataouinensis]|uniref:enoyl-CoA hydratase/isomerase family protein n=1 Tax=Ramlibacter tataouinensis TaxID=94132 RepID=UPI0022F3B7BB|nr:enoyl-CoA hydratase/isomerase family protein [Ramlibacter tataouinensis]WBY03566.1 enoyl-CoA hydratase/isomerase family protein [Ramlibacter tataouinensis]
MEYVLLRNEGPVSIVSLNRPERLNAIGTGLLRDLQVALDRAQADPATRVIVFTGEGRAFCAGDDLKEFDQQAGSPESIAHHADSVQQITRTLMFGSKLVVGAVRGHAVGGGFEWVLNCDLIVAGDDLVGFFPEMSLGHFVTGGVTHLLPLAVGHQKAMELLVLGERQGAQALQRLGIVKEVVPPSEVLPRALELARQVAERSPHALARLKRAMAADPGRLAAALETERRACVELSALADTAARIAKATQGL